MINTVDVKPIINTADINDLSNAAATWLIPIETVNYGFMGLQTYQGVEIIADDKKG